MNFTRIFLLLGTALGVTILLLVTALFFVQRRLLFLPSHLDTAAKGQEPFVAWRSQEKFLGYVSRAVAPKEALLFFHGNAGEALHRTWARDLAPASTTVYLVEYPGFGARAGEPTEASLFAAATEAFDAVATELNVPIAVAGESLGTGVAAYLSSVRPVSRLALISPYTSMTDVAAYHYPWVPVRWLLKDRMESERYLKNVRIPLAILHGEFDTIVPFALGQRLFDGYGGPVKQLNVVPRGQHNDMATALMSAPEAAPFKRFLSGTP